MSQKLLLSGRKVVLVDKNKRKKHETLKCLRGDW